LHLRVPQGRIPLHGIDKRPLHADGNVS